MLAALQLFALAHAAAVCTTGNVATDCQICDLLADECVLCKPGHCITSAGTGCEACTSGSSDGSAKCAATGVCPACNGVDAANGDFTGCAASTCNTITGCVACDSTTAANCAACRPGTEVASPASGACVTCQSGKMGTGTAACTACPNGATADQSACCTVAGCAGSAIPKCVEAGSQSEVLSTKGCLRCSGALLVDLRSTEIHATATPGFCIAAADCPTTGSPTARLVKTGSADGADHGCADICVAAKAGCLTCATGASAGKCEVCETGYRMTSYGSCEPCPAGSVSTGWSATTCTACAPATDLPNSDASACIAKECMPGAGANAVDGCTACDTATPALATCVSCREELYLDVAGNQCKKCGAGEKLNSDRTGCMPSRCTTTTAGCSDCDGSSAETCIACITGRFLEKRAGQTLACVTRAACEGANHRGGKIDGDKCIDFCTAKKGNCMTCGTTSVCSKCDPGYLIVNIATDATHGTCVAAAATCVSDGTATQQETAGSKWCSINCTGDVQPSKGQIACIKATCSGAALTTDYCVGCTEEAPAVCSTCFSTHLLHGSSKTCVLPKKCSDDGDVAYDTTCENPDPDMTNYKISGGKYRMIVYNESCSGIKGCSACYLTETSVACLECAYGTLTMRRCPVADPKCAVANAKTCAADKPYVAEACNTNYELVAGVCVPKCKVPASGANSCLLCEGGPTACTLCADGFFLKGGACTACPANCGRCKIDGRTQAGEDKVVCLECAAGKTGVKEASVCSAACDASCARCNETSATSCTACAPGFRLAGTKCVACTNSACGTCAPDSGSTPGYCLSRTCAAGALFVGATFDSGICIFPYCIANCRTCATATTCAAEGCYPGYFLKDEKCTKCKTGHCVNCPGDVCKDCADGYYLSEGKCMACSKNCEYCTSGTTCEACAEGYGDQVNGACTVKCENNCLYCDKDAACQIPMLGYGLDAGKKPVKCTTANCATCDGAKPAECMACFQTHYLSNKVCTACPDGKVCSRYTCATKEECNACPEGTATTGTLNTDTQEFVAGKTCDKTAVRATCSGLVGIAHTVQPLGVYKEAKEFCGICETTASKGEALFGATLPRCGKAAAGGLSAGAIAGIVIAAVVVVAAVVLGAVFGARACKAKKGSKAAPMADPSNIALQPLSPA